MLKKTFCVLTLLAAGTGVAMGQDASSYPAARLQSPAQYSANGSAQPAAPAGRPSPYSNYQSTTMTADGVVAAPAPAGTAIAGAPTTGCASCGGSAAKCCLHGWFIGEYLLLFPNRMSVPALVTTADGATPLVGPSPDLGITHGFRINMGMWLCDGDIGMQSIILGTIRSYVTLGPVAGTIPLVVAGATAPVAVTAFNYQSWHQIDGGEGNSLLHVAGDDATRVYLLGGGRYLNVSDDVTTRYTIGAANFFDDFHTRDQFFGFNVGAMVSHRQGNLDLDLTAKVALGLNYTQLFIMGSNTANTGPQAFTQSSNIGYYESNYFGVLPEFDANIGYRITERLGVRIGYTFMMDINMWRAGNQIQTTFPPALNPAARSTYFAHGLNAGATFRY
jgi:hypothetical protein